MFLRKARLTSLSLVCLLAAAGVVTATSIVIPSDDELIIGVRDNLGEQPQERRGVRIYKAVDDHAKTVVDPALGSVRTALEAMSGDIIKTKAEIEGFQKSSEAWLCLRQNLQLSES